MSVALVSCLKLPEPDPDQDPLSAALHAAGVEARVLAWDDPAVNWSRADLTVLRSSWNYPLRPADFLAWAEATPILYARVDVAPGPDGRPVIMELELIEPSLFFIRHPPALDRFVRALSSRL